ncbi:MAG: Maf family protein [Desulfovibrio sp.]|jgi:septum formation protein|nr:Maf family protein [Desulfovibrio sp.]
MTRLFMPAPGLRLVLASASPRRRRFLEDWGLPFTLFCPKEVEPSPISGESPEHYACRAAETKTLAAAEQMKAQDALVLGADTVVAIDGNILGKPRDAGNALDMLVCLSGRGHEVISAVCLLLPDGRRKIFPTRAGFFFREYLQKNVLFICYLRNHKEEVCRNAQNVIARISLKMVSI